MSNLYNICDVKGGFRMWNSTNWLLTDGQKWVKFHLNMSVCLEDCWFGIAPLREILREIACRIYDKIAIPGMVPKPKIAKFVQVPGHTTPPPSLQQSVWIHFCLLLSGRVIEKISTNQPSYRTATVQSTSQRNILQMCHQDKIYHHMLHTVNQKSQQRSLNGFMIGTQILEEIMIKNERRPEEMNYLIITLPAPRDPRAVVCPWSWSWVGLISIIVQSPG